MIAQNTDSFVLGEDNYPAWFKEFCQKHTVQFTRKHDNTYKVDIYNTTGVVTALTGDTLMYIAGSIVVVPKAAAEEYMKEVQK